MSTIENPGAVGAARVDTVTKRGGLRKRRNAMLIAAIGIASVGLTACSSGDTGTTNAAGTVDTDATLVVGARLSPTNLDIQHTSGVAISQVLLNNVYETLLKRQPDGSLVPSLATEYDVSSDSLTYTFTLAPDAAFSNGDALTSSDVVASLKAFASDANAVASDKDAFSKVAAFEAPDDGTVVITLTSPDPTLLYSLGGLAGIVLDEEATFDATTTAVGSGPFLLDSFTAGQPGELVLARNEDYWGTAPSLKEVDIKYYKDSTSEVTGLTSGEADVITNVEPTLQSQLSGFTVTKGTASDKFVLAFNNAVAPFTDERVRQAIRHAVDNEALIKAANGAGIDQGGPIPVTDPGYEPLTDLYPYDPDKAIELLGQAGYSTSKPLSLKLELSNTYGTTITDLLTSQFKEVGIDLSVETVDFPTWISDVLTNKDFQLSIVDHAESRDFGATWMNPDYYFGYSNPKATDLYNQALAAASQDEYEDLLKQAAKVVSNDAPAEWLYNPQIITAMQDYVEGFPTDSTTANLDFSTVSVTE